MGQLSQASPKQNARLAIASQHRDETAPYDLPPSALPAEQLISAATEQAKLR